MNKQYFHKDFSLNGEQFGTISELLEYCKTLPPSVFVFLSEWFSNAPTVVVQTSGSTGTPKKIQLQKQHMIHSAIATGTFFNLPERTSVFLCLSTDYIAGKMMLVRALVLGWHLDIVEASSQPLSGVDRIYDFAAMVPLQLYNSIDKLDNIKKMIVGGGSVSKKLQQKISSRQTSIFSTYGMTETSTHIAVKKLNNFDRSKHSFGSVDQYSTSHYKVLPNINISKDSRECLIINAPNISDETIITNDLVELISESEFKWLGRYDTMINSGGVKLIPEQIENKLSAVIDRRFFVTGVADDILGEKLILIIESKKESSVILNKVQHLITLNKFEIPKEIYFIEKFVETGSKKINRHKTITLI